MLWCSVSYKGDIAVCHQIHYGKLPHLMLRDVQFNYGKRSLHA